MKKLVQKMLANMASTILRRYNPKVVGITGSVGKTSSKHAAYVVLSSKFNTRTGDKNYNNEFGLPLAIIGSKSPRRNPFKWIGLFFKSLWLEYGLGKYPEVLVLEMGVDRKGDMDHLVSIARPSVAVITTIGFAHMEFFGTQDAILKEKSRIFKYVGPKGYSIINLDDPKLKTLLPTLPGNVLTYGFDSSADLRILDCKPAYSNKMPGTIMHLSYKGKTETVFLTNTIGLPHVQACAVGAAVGLAFNMNLNQISKALQNYTSQPGRLRVFDGMRSSVIIDDTYNASPQSMEMALLELHKYPLEDKVAILGDMRELGDISETAHMDVAKQIEKHNIGSVLLVGPQMKHAYNHLINSGYDSKNISWFEKSTEAISKAKDLMKPDRIVLVKGSQGIRMEKIVKEIMAEPEKAKELLCRQDPEWI